VVVVGLEIGVGDVRPEIYVAKETKPRAGRGPVEDTGDGLDLLVVWSNAITDKAVGSRKPIEHVDRDHILCLLQQATGGVEARGAGADDGDTQWAIRGAKCGRHASLLSRCKHGGQRRTAHGRGTS